MDLGLKGRVALIGGSSRGLGFAAALELAREGCGVVICARDAAAVTDAARNVTDQTGADATGVVADLSTSEGVAQVVQTAHDRYGRVVVLVTTTGPPAAPSRRTRRRCGAPRCRRTWRACSI